MAYNIKARFNYWTFCVDSEYFSNGFSINSIINKEAKELLISLPDQLF